MNVIKFLLNKSSQFFGQFGTSHFSSLFKAYVYMQCPNRWLSYGTTAADITLHHHNFSQPKMDITMHLNAVRSFSSGYLCTFCIQEKLVMHATHFHLVWFFYVKQMCELLVGSSEAVQLSAAATHCACEWRVSRDWCCNEKENSLFRRVEHSEGV